MASSLCTSIKLSMTIGKLAHTLSTKAGITCSANLELTTPTTWRTSTSQTMATGLWDLSVSRRLSRNSSNAATSIPTTTNKIVSHASHWSTVSTMAAGRLAAGTPLMPCRGMMPDRSTSIRRARGAEAAEAVSMRGTFKISTANAKLTIAMT